MGAQLKLVGEFLLALQVGLLTGGREPELQGQMLNLAEGAGGWAGGVSQVQQARVNNPCIPLNEALVSSSWSSPSHSGALWHKVRERMPCS